MTPAPTLFDAMPTGTARQCRRCRLIRGQTKPRCRRCGAYLADEAQWLWAWTWAGENVGLLRQAIAAVRPDIARVADAAEIVSLSLIAVVRAAMGYEGGRGTKLSTFIANGVRLAAYRMPGNETAATGCEWSRMECPRGNIEHDDETN